MLKVGDEAPLFSAATDEGTISLEALRGNKVVLYFYPKDSTSGCTLEARGFRDLHDQFAARNVRILGISRDSAARHRSFKSKEGLPFTLVVDEGGLCEAYGVWREKKLYGRAYQGIARVTFLIDAAGKIERIWDPVKANGHAAEILATLTTE